MTCCPLPGFSTCVLLFYNCSESLDSCRQQFRVCAATSSNSAPDPEVSTAVLSSTSTSPSTSIPAPSPGTRMSPGAVDETGDAYTPSLAQGSGKIPESKF